MFCVKCKKTIGNGGVWQDDGTALCYDCDQKVAKAAEVKAAELLFRRRLLVSFGGVVVAGAIIWCKCIAYKGADDQLRKEAPTLSNREFEYIYGNRGNFWATLKDNCSPLEGWCLIILLLFLIGRIFFKRDFKV